MHTQAYNPLGFGQTKMPENMFYYSDVDGKLNEWQMNPSNWTPNAYYGSVSLKNGWFCPQVLRAKAVKKPNKKLF